MRVEFQTATLKIKNNKKLAILKSLPQPFGSLYIDETWQISLMVLFCSSELICKNFREYVWRYCTPKFEQWKKKTKVTSFPCRCRTNMQIYSKYSLPDLKHDQKHFIRIPSLNFPKMRPLARLSQFYQITVYSKSV